MNREQMAEKIAAMIVNRARFDDTASAILDAVLPQITTVEELEALPVGTWLLDDDGNDWRKRPNTLPTLDGQLIWGPLTVVWQPQD